MADRPVSDKMEQPLRSKEVKVRPAAKQICPGQNVINNYREANYYRSEKAEHFEMWGLIVQQAKLVPY